VVHADLHVDAAHRYAPQLEADAVAHAPRPSQNDAGVTLPPVQLAGPQIVEVPGTAPHAVRSEPLHVAWHAPVPVHAVREPWTLPITAEHLPALPPTSHASHWPVHVVSQHTPSTQCPEPHSESALHVVASGLLHVPSPLALHLRPDAHVALEQHTPSTQLPLEHSVLDEHVAASASLGTQLAALQ
jgi:hypothetical protein